MKKFVSTLMIASVFAVGFSVFNPANVNAQQPTIQFEDDGDLCPCIGNQCTFIGGGQNK